ncbi:abnormal spindle-like microcephaly-associated protein [Nothobranchius furzeri]|uniref:abnormal spindle-like microcephaly-associated protein n=1 Tax=Nothobranchius furzeri TaxID=105023 RepID=UPI003904DA3E
MAEAGTQRGVLDFSPVRKNNTANKENDHPVLSLIQFSKPPFVTFGTVKLGTSKSVVLRIENPIEDVEAEVTVNKIPSSKGFSVEHNTFTIQPESSFTLTITWTPAEEGGFRELLIFSANGVLKHQAVLLGRAEAPKKNKKSLWDSIKNKRKGDQRQTQKKTVPPLKMVASKTFQVSRNPQYKRGKPRPPLASLELSQSKHGSGGHHWSITGDHYYSEPGEQKCLGSLQSAADQERRHDVHNNSPVVLLVPAAKLMDSGGVSNSLKPKNKELTQLFNKTLSPIGTPDMLKRLMPHIQSDASVNVSGDHTAPSLKDALDLIGSDLILHTSPRDTSSGCEFSDSLEYKSGKPDCRSDKSSSSGQPRLTFFVSKKAVSEDVNVGEKVKKPPFTSATVTKGKAPAEVGSPGGRRTKKSRRRLLEKTTEFSDSSSSQSDSCSDTPSLPVIDTGAGSTLGEDGHQLPEFMSSSPKSKPHCSPAPITFPISSPLHPAPSSFSFSVTSPPPSVHAPTTFTITSSPPAASSSTESVQAPTSLAPVSAEDDPFPVQLEGKSKKRKSGEDLNGGSEDAGESKHVKRSRGVAAKTDSLRSAQERRGVSQRAARSVHAVTSSSLRKTKPAVAVQAKRPNSRVLSQGASSVKRCGSESVTKAKVVAVAQSKLTFVKPPQTALPRHPMPFAAKNMFYDERWIEKQERGFAWWINYVLTPDDFKVNTEVAKVSAVSLAMGIDDKFSAPKAPTKEEMSFSTYTAKHKLNRLRRSACQLFTSEVMVKAIQRLELEVEARRLLVRKDRHLWKDIGERKKVLNWLLSYNPLWLRIGLETVFGELISLESNSDILGLAMFILQRLLWNPDIAAEFRHPRVPHLYKDGHEEALSRFTLKKLLLLVCFLDRAKESRLIEHDPCLFCLDAEFKATKDLLLAFSRDFLSGEGILPRHLSYLGLPVSHVQTPLNEFSFAVNNLAVDLKCGIRLVRVMELLVQDWSLSAKLRLPAISRLQKVHNVDLALQVLTRKGIDLKDEHGAVIESRDIVDGHREKTLSLLWKILFSFHVEVILDEDQLREEICFLRRTLRTKRRLASARADRGFQPSPETTPAPYQHTSTKVALLMDWVRAVSDFYGLKVENFTVSFSDGRVLCYLIHHYHPGLLPGASISTSTTQTVECSQRGRLELNCSSGDSDCSLDAAPTGSNGPDSSPLVFKELLENEKSNFRLVNAAVSSLGGVPAMISPADMSNTIPSEKVVMSYLSFLCARLLDLRNETRAARVIQAAWRKHRLQKDLQLYEERNQAAGKIQLAVRRFLQKRRAERQNGAAVVIQAFWRGYSARNRMRLEEEARIRAVQHKAATVIQAQWRTLFTLRAYQRLRYYTIIVQAQWRMRRAAAAYEKTYWAATVIQKHSRATALSRRDRERYLLLKASVVKIQQAFRRWKAQKVRKQNRAAAVIQAAFKKWFKAQTAEKAAAAVAIQAWYRMQLCFCRYNKMRRSALLIQAHFRGHEQRRRFQTLKLRRNSALVIQSAFRGHTVRKEFLKLRCAAVIIQRRWRASTRRDAQREAFVRIRCAAVKIQAAYRGQAARELLRKQLKAATAIQAAFRSHAAQKRYLVVRKAAGLIQQRYRARALALKAKKEYDAVRRAAIVLQASWRGRTDRKKVGMWHQRATLIQTCFRRHKAQTEYRCKKAAAVVIQRRYKAFLVGKETRSVYIQQRRAFIALQAGFRGMRVRTELRKKHQAATIIQSVVRMFLCRKRYVLLQSAAIIIQCRYRALLLGREQRSEFRNVKRAAINIQAALRGFRVRTDLKKRHDAARMIQAQFRMYRIRRAYLATRCAVLTIQERYRANVLRDELMQAYKIKRAAAVVIQAAYRGHRARRRVTEMHQAARIIQRKFLATRARTQFLAIRAAALVCQQRYRAALLARKVKLDYVSKRRAVVCLQAAYRGYAVRKQLHKWQRAAVAIQSHFRKHQQRSSYKKLLWACSVLQTRYRANKQMRAEVQALCAKRNATVVLQAAYRGMKSRQRVKQHQNAACVIQAAFRACCERRRYLALRSCVIKLQLRYRANAAAKTQIKQYKQIRRATVTLQAAFRGLRVRRDVAGWHRAATVIQSVFRRHRAQVKYQALRLSTIIIQRRYRALLLQQHDRETFLETKRCAVVLQAAFRGSRVRKDIAKMHKAASIIQASFRQHRQQTAFRQQRWAARILQQRFRAQRRKHLEVKRYQEVRKAAAVLQAAYRGMKARQMVQQRHRAAGVIQRAFKAHRQRRKYSTLKSSALTIQKRYRATVTAKKQMQQYKRIRSAAVIVQAAYRGLRVRRDVAGWHRAATVIQSAFRRHREQVKYRAMRLSTVLIQRRYRACVLQRRDRDHFLKTKQSVVILQATFRGYRVRMETAKMHRAASVIQANFRRYKQQTTFIKQLWAARVLQQRFRAQKCKNHEAKRYQELRKAAVILQAACRGMKSRKIIKQKHQAASIIQIAFRAHCEHKEFLTLKSSVLSVQRRYRATVATNKQRRQYKEMQRATIALQAAYRGLRVRREVSGWHRAATVIQSAFRRHREQVKYQAMRLSTIIIQRRYRALLLQQHDRETFLKTKRCAVVLQAAFRGSRVRKDIAKMHKAASIIQAKFRQHRQQTAFRQQRWAARILQQRFRAQRRKHLEVKRYQEVRKAAAVLQAAYRGMKARQMVQQRHRAAGVIQRAFKAHRQRRKYSTLKSSALTIQKRYRATVTAKKQMQQYKRIRSAAVIVQAAYRGLRVRRDVAGWHRAATVIQSAFRRHREQVKYRAMRLSTVLIQRRYRACVLQRRNRDHFLKTKQSVVILQAAFRGYRVRMETAKMHRAASVIQANFRRYKQQTTFIKQLWAARVLQQRFRAQKCKNHEAKRYQELRKAAVILQAACRGMKSRKIINQKHQAASIIQRFFRGHHDRQQYLKVKTSIVTIQQRYRATIQARAERNRYIRQQQAAVTLQRFCRAWSARQQVLKAAHAERRLRFTSAVFHHLRAIKIQRALRAHWALESAKKQIRSVIIIQRWVRAMQQRRRFQEDRRKVITAQRAVRSWLARRHKAASVLQQAVRKLLFIRRRQRVLRGITKAQALWRGHRSRQLNDDMKLSKLRLRLRKVSADVQEEDKLCNKTTSALEYLLRYKHFSYIIQALKNLETATRLSPVCCERLVESGAINVIFTQIRCCNRSLPCMEVITLSVQILLNLSKYHKTVEAVYSVENSVETLLDLLQRYRDKAGDKVAEKGGSIFTKTCFLIALLLQDPHRVEEVKKIPHALDRLCSIYKLTARKHKLDAERNIVKLKMNASVNGSVLATPRKSPPVPKFSPDWVLTRNNLKEIVHPLRAIQMVADTLSIVL